MLLRIKVACKLHPNFMHEYYTTRSYPYKSFFYPFLRQLLIILLNYKIKLLNFPTDLNKHHKCTKTALFVTAVCQTMFNACVPRQQTQLD